MASENFFTVTCDCWLLSFWSIPLHRAFLSSPHAQDLLQSVHVPCPSETKPGHGAPRVMSWVPTRGRQPPRAPAGCALANAARLALVPISAMSSWASLSTKAFLVSRWTELYSQCLLEASASSAPPGTPMSASKLHTSNSDCFLLTEGRKISVKMMTLVVSWMSLLTWGPSCTHQQVTDPCVLLSEPSEGFSSAEERSQSHLCVSALPWWS